jgi:hypothetical protein
MRRTNEDFILVCREEELILLTKRDFKIIEYLEVVKCAKSKHIQTVFNISQNVANRRLLELTRLNKLKKKRYDYSLEYIYYLPKEKPTEHKILVSEFYIKLFQNNGRIIKFYPEYIVNNIRADIFCVYQIQNLCYYFFVEIQLSHDRPNIQKYEWLLDRQDFIPRIVVVTNQKWKYDGKLTVLGVDTEFNNFEKIFKHSTL